MEWNPDTGALKTIKKYDDHLSCKEDVLRQGIWFNSNIKTANKILFNKPLYNSDIRYLSDLRMDNRWLTYDELCKKSGSK